MTGRADGHVVLAAGGTGGHMFPAEALAEALGEKGCTPILFTDARGGAFSARHGALETHFIPARAVTGNPIARLAGLVELTRGIGEAARLLRGLGPRVAVGFGGYASVPTMLAATRAGIATVIHEQNAVLGRANRLLARRVTTIATSFDEVARVAPRARHKIIRTGNPVRPAIAALAARDYALAAETGPLRLLVIGGSQGADVFGRVVPEAVARLPDRLRARLDISQQCRADHLEEVIEAYRVLGLEPRLAPFLDDIPELLGRAHLVICRGGASSVAEVTTAGRPAIIVPYPFATDDHQSANARALERAGGAWLIPQEIFTGEVLATHLESFLRDPEALAKAGAAARRCGTPDAAARLCAVVLALIPNGDGRRPEERHGPREAAA